MAEGTRSNGLKRAGISGDLGSDEAQHCQTALPSFVHDAQKSDLNIGTSTLCSEVNSGATLHPLVLHRREDVLGRCCKCTSRSRCLSRSVASKPGHGCECRTAGRECTNCVCGQEGRCRNGGSKPSEHRSTDDATGVASHPNGNKTNPKATRKSTLAGTREIGSYFKPSTQYRPTQTSTKPQPFFTLEEVATNSQDDRKPAAVTNSLLKPAPPSPPPSPSPHPPPPSPPPFLPPPSPTPTTHTHTRDPFEEMAKLVEETITAAEAEPISTATVGEDDATAVAPIQDDRPNREVPLGKRRQRRRIHRQPKVTTQHRRPLSPQRQPTMRLHHTNHPHAFPETQRQPGTESQGRQQPPSRPALATTPTLPDPALHPG